MADKIKCTECGCAIVVKDKDYTYIKSRIVRYNNSITEAKCAKCKTFVSIDL
jgi:hypothetical protein